MSDKRPEQSIASARASVMIYDDLNKKWMPSGSSHGLSKVHIYHHFLNSTFRVVGRKLQDHEVVINCAILKGLKYNQATATFHQWRDQKQVYGLNFSSRDDAEVFAAAMLRALDVLNSGGTLAMRAAPNVPPQQQQNQFQQQQQQQQQNPVYQQPHQHNSNEAMYDAYEEYGGGGSLHSVNNGSNTPHYGGSDPGYDSSQMIHMQQQQQQQQQIEMERRLSVQQQNSQSHLHQVHSSPAMTGMAPQPIPQQQQQQQTSPSQMNGAPGPPPPPSQQMAKPPGVPQAPPPPPSSINIGASTAPPQPTGGAPPPPPPPPPPPSGDNGGPVGAPSGLAAALQAAKLRKTSQQQPKENSGGSTTSSNSSGYGTIGRTKEMTGGAPPMISMMDEMQKTLARRRAKVERQDDDETGDNKKSTSPTGTVKSNSGSESPKQNSNPVGGSIPRKRFGSIADDLDVAKFNGNSSASLAESAGNTANGGNAATSADLEAVKQEILTEMRKEMAKMKLEIIEAIRMEMNRR